MTRWKARVEFLLSVIELLFLSLTVEALQGKMYQNSLPSGGGRSLGAKISGEGSSPANILTPLEIVSFGDGRNLIREGKMFIKDESKFASKVSGVK